MKKNQKKTTSNTQEKNHIERAACRPGKRSKHYEEAARLYIIEGCTFAQIKKKLKVSETSLLKWAEYGNWHDERNQQLSLGTSALLDAKSIVDKVGKMILQLLDKKEVPNAALLNYHSRLLAGLTKIKEFEDKEKQEQPHNSESSLTDKTQEAVQHYFTKQ